MTNNRISNDDMFVAYVLSDTERLSKKRSGCGCLLAIFVVLAIIWQLLVPALTFVALIAAVAFIMWISYKLYCLYNAKKTATAKNGVLSVRNDTNKESRDGDDSGKPDDTTHLN